MLSLDRALTLFNILPAEIYHSHRFDFRDNLFPRNYRLNLVTVRAGEELDITQIQENVHICPQIM